MRLYHTTHRRNCAPIAERGFIDSTAGKYGPGVYLSAGVTHRENGRTHGDYEPADADCLPADLVVFAFDVPDDVAARFACGGCVYLAPDDPDFDPELDTPDPLVPDGLPPDEWVVPAEIVNRHFAGVLHWSGEPPLSAAQLGAMAHRTLPGSNTNHEGSR